MKEKTDAELVAMPVRPLTYKFMATVLEAVGTQLESVRIDTLKKDTYYAVVSLKSGDKLREVDARPSDAIALALHMNSPIYVAQELLEQQGIKVPADIEKHPLGKGLEHLREKREQEKRDFEERLSRLSEEKIEEQIQEAHQKLISFLFSAE
ncbi:bifunctional nuclease family protein [Tolypothrix campylonemoides VB511288]|nr:bifunctional nuclease family protein [Tolypothrix campylonemoides VB511288]